jgi:hypothetical protein
MRASIRETACADGVVEVHGAPACDEKHNAAAPMPKLAEDVKGKLHECCI